MLKVLENVAPAFPIMFPEPVTVPEPENLLLAGATMVSP
jgi:hypothetical protein